MDQDLDLVTLDVPLKIAFNLDRMFHFFLRHPLDEQGIALVPVPDNAVHKPAGKDLGKVAVSEGFQAHLSRRPRAQDGLLRRRRKSGRITMMSWRGEPRTPQTRLHLPV